MARELRGDDDRVEKVEKRRFAIREVVQKEDVFTTGAARELRRRIRRPVAAVGQVSAWVELGETFVEVLQKERAERFGQGAVGSFGFQRGVGDKGGRVDSGVVEADETIANRFAIEDRVVRFDLVGIDAPRQGLAQQGGRRVGRVENARTRQPRRASAEGSRASLSRRRSRRRGSYGTRRRGRGSR